VPRLVVFRGDDVQSEVPLRGSVVRIGRDARNEIVLDDAAKAISRFHAEVRPEGGGYVISDLRSRNGIWVRGQRVERTTLELGIPVTVGSFEVVLEDDLASGVFEDPPSTGGATVALVRDAEDDRHRRPPAGPAPPHRPQRRAGPRLTIIALVTLAAAGLGAIAWVVVTNVRAPAPTATTTSVVPETVASATTTSVEPPSPVDPNRTRIEENLSMAKMQLEAGNYMAAIASAEVVLALEPQNTDALDVRRQAAEAARQRAPRPTPEPVQEKEGIPRRAGESPAEYNARVSRIESALASGRESLAKQEYAAAIGHFHLIEQDEPKYPGIQGLVADAAAQQQRAFTEAMTNGQAHETRGSLKDARGWYERAVAVDPDSTAARDKAAAIRGRLFDQARKLLEQGNYAAKSADQESALSRYRQVLDLLRPGDELRDQAARQIEELNK